MVSKGDPYWTISLGLAGIIAASAGNDLYHPMQALFIGAVAAVIAYKMHFWVERRFKLDDPVGAVAVHGYAGTFGVIVAGFMLWGYPAAAPIDLSGWWVESLGWFGVTEDGYPAINPLGNLIGAFIMFGLLGFLPTYLLAKLFQAFGILREPREVELVGADTYRGVDMYPYFARAESEFEAVERQYVDK
jgi:ammonia channel protein AmtB